MSHAALILMRQGGPHISWLLRAPITARLSRGTSRTTATRGMDSQVPKVLACVNNSSYARIGKTGASAVLCSDLLPMVVFNVNSFLMKAGKQ